MSAVGSVIAKVTRPINVGAVKFVLYDYSFWKELPKLDPEAGVMSVDLSHEDSKKFTTILTQQGLFQYERLPFVIKTAPALFQRTMETLLRDFPYACAYIDNILITDTDEQNHLNNLELLQRLESAGLTLKKSKCIFTATSVEYLGHVIDKNGLHSSPFQKYKQ